MAGKRRMAGSLASFIAVVLLVTTGVAVGRTSSSAAGVTEWATTLQPGRPFGGLGYWEDMYAWSETFTGNQPTFNLGDVDAMAADGAQTLYIQAAQELGPPTVLEHDRLLALINRA